MAESRARPWTVLLAALVLVGCGEDTAEPTPPFEPSPLALHYPFEGDALDASGNGHDAEVVGPVPTVDRFGRPAGAYEFDGVDDYMVTAESFDFEPRTVAFWFRLREHMGRYQRILVQNSHALEFGAFGLGITADRRFEGRAGGNGTYLVSDSLVVAGRWYHVALIRDGSQERYYLNGALVATTTGSSGGSISGNPYLMIGTTRVMDRFFGGAVDDVRIYEGALTDDEVARLYSRGGA